MLIKDFFGTNNLHNSLMEHIAVDREAETIKLEMDFCYWLQEDYVDGTPDRGTIGLIFEGVSYVDGIPLELNSDEVISCELDGANTVLIRAYSDILSDVYTITITAENVKKCG